MKKKFCPICQVDKDITEFSKKGEKYYQSYCKKCQVTLNNQYKPKKVNNKVKTGEFTPQVRALLGYGEGFI